MYCAATAADCPFVAKKAQLMKMAKNRQCGPDETSCPAGCCPEANWFCCPDNMYCAATAACATVNCTRLGCQAPIQATLRRPLWVLRGSFLVCHLEVTPLTPLPLVTPIMSIISSLAKTSVIGICFSK